MANKYATVESLRLQIGKESKADDTTLIELLDAAAAAIDSICNRHLFGFLADTTATARLYTGSGEAIQYIDECTEITALEVKGSPTDSDYTAWAATDYLPFRGAIDQPDFNHTPYTKIMVEANGSYAVFTSGAIAGRKLPTVRVTARWGFADKVPEQIRQSTIIQAARWYKRAEAQFADEIGQGEFRSLRFVRGIDPAVKTMLEEGRFIAPEVG